MKVALCLSGHLRKFEETFPSINNFIIKNYECDVFIHTWDKMGYASNYKTDPNLNNTEHKVSKVHELYNPKKLIIESSAFVEELKRQGNEYAPHLRNVPKHVGHMASMFYKIYACNELRKRHELETGIKYDVVIRCRPDLSFNEPVIIPSQIAPKHILFSHLYSSPGWYTDQFAIGLPNDMDIYSSFFFNMPEYFRARNEFYPEKFMDWSLKKSQLTPQMINISFCILR